MLEPSNECLTIDLLILPDTNLILVAAVIEPLRAANRISGRTLYQWRIFTPDGTPVDTTCHIPIPPHLKFEPIKDNAPLFVLASYNWSQPATPLLIRQLSRTASLRPMIVGIESGTWLLARAGLLNGATATTHWEDFDDFSAVYPAVSLIKDRFVICDKRITTSGSLPTIDLMLEIIRQRQGATLFREVARLFNYDSTGFGTPIKDRRASASQHVDRRIDRTLVAMEEHIEQPLGMTELARRIGVSARYLQVLFQENLGLSPQQYYLTLRMNAARRLIIETNRPLPDVAAATGFASISGFARSYRSAFGETATHTRRRVRGAAYS